MKKLTQYITEFIKTGNIKSNTVQTVDLGFPSGTLWADRNIGATSPEDPGLLFQWGHTDGYQFNDKSVVNHYQNDMYDSYPSGKDPDSYHSKDRLVPDDDAATANIGHTWNMPTKEQLVELFKHTTQMQETRNGQDGWVLKSVNNDNELFIPANGYFSGDTGEYITSDHAYLWSNTCASDNNAFLLWLNKINIYVTNNFMDYGYSVRGVQSK